MVTYGTPSGSVATINRLDFVCNTASGLSTITDCAAAIFNSLPNSPAPFSQNDPSPIWLLHVNNANAQCPVLEIFLDAHFQLLGLGSGVLKYCYANADGTSTASTTAPSVTRSCVPGNNGHPSPTTAPHNTYNDNEALVLWAAGTPNSFEAVDAFNNLYYALGEGIFATPSAVVNGSFSKIVWDFDNGNDTNNFGFTDCQYDSWQSH